MFRLLFTGSNCSVIKSSSNRKMNPKNGEPKPECAHVLPTLGENSVQTRLRGGTGLSIHRGTATDPTGSGCGSRTPRSHPRAITAARARTETRALSADHTHWPCLAPCWQPNKFFDRRPTFLPVVSRASCTVCTCPRTCVVRRRSPTYTTHARHQWREARVRHAAWPIDTNPLGDVCLPPHHWTCHRCLPPPSLNNPTRNSGDQHRRSCAICVRSKLFSASPDTPASSTATGVVADKKRIMPSSTMDICMGIAVVSDPAPLPPSLHRSVS